MLKDSNVQRFKRENSKRKKERRLSFAIVRHEWMMSDTHGRAAATIELDRGEYRKRVE